MRNQFDAVSTRVRLYAVSGVRDAMLRSFGAESVADFDRVHVALILDEVNHDSRIDFDVLECLDLMQAEVC